MSFHVGAPRINPFISESGSKTLESLPDSTLKNLQPSEPQPRTLGSGLQTPPPPTLTLEPRALPTGIGNLGEQLKTINGDPTNPGGICMRVSVEVAEVLTSGKPPVAKATLADRNPDDAGDLAKAFSAAEGPGEVFDWLSSSAAEAGAVYAVENGGEHAYNFVKDHDNKLYLIDASFHVFTEIKSPEDLTQTVREDRGAEEGVVEGPCFYGTATSDDRNPEVELFKAGTLHSNWSDLL